MRVVAERGQQGGGGVRAYTVDGLHLWCGSGGDGVDMVFQPRGFDVQLAATRGQRADRRGDGIGWGDWGFRLGKLQAALQQPILVQTGQLFAQRSGSSHQQTLQGGVGLGTGSHHAGARDPQHPHHLRGAVSSLRLTERLAGQHRDASH